MKYNKMGINLLMLSLVLDLGALEESRTPDAYLPQLACVCVSKCASILTRSSRRDEEAAY